MTRAASGNSVPAPSPLKLGGDIAADWERFRSEWENYEVAADLVDVPAKKRVAVFLACIGSAAYGVFRTFKFEIREHGRHCRRQQDRRRISEALHRGSERHL